MTLPEYIAENLSRRFCFGIFDCVLWASTWVKSYTGIDTLDGIPQWTSEQEARSIIKSVGGLDAAIDKYFPRTTPSMAQDGDIGRHENAIGIFSGSHIVLPGIEGLMFIDRTQVKCAWSLS